MSIMNEASFKGINKNPFEYIACMYCGHSNFESVWGLGVMCRMCHTEYVFDRSMSYVPKIAVSIPKDVKVSYMSEEFHRHLEKNYPSVLESLLKRDKSETKESVTAWNMFIQTKKFYLYFKTMSVDVQYKVRIPSYGIDIAYREYLNSEDGISCIPTLLVDENDRVFQKITNYSGNVLTEYVL